MSMVDWIDLTAGEQVRLSTEAEVCVIGAGAAGIYLSRQLVQHGLSVILVEAGPTTGAEPSAVGFEAIFGNEHYSGATAGRFFGMGGSTTRWGGVLVPHTYLDFRDGAPANNAWTHIVGTVATRGPAVLRALGYTDGDDFVDYAQYCLGEHGRNLSLGGLSAQCNLHLPFQRKNLVGMLDQRMGVSGGLRVFFNAVAKSWKAQSCSNKDAHLQQLVAVSRNRNELRVSAGKYVICAGAIESTRMLLEMREDTTPSLLRETALIGYYLGDHLSLPIADVAKTDLDLTRRLFAPRFLGPWMRGFRFLEHQAPTDAPRAFAHFMFLNHSRGFELAKLLLGAIQKRRIPKVDIGDFVAGIGDLLRLSYGRMIESRLYIPLGTRTQLQLDMEQIPSRDNRISLSAQRDGYGRRVPRIDWHVSDLDMRALHRCSGILCIFFRYLYNV